MLGSLGRTTRHSNRTMCRRTARQKYSIMRDAPSFVRTPQLLVGSNRRLNFRLVDVEVRIHVLHVVVFFQRFH